MKPMGSLHKKIMRAKTGMHFTYSTQELYVKFSKLSFKQVYLYMLNRFSYECTQDDDFAFWFPRSLELGTKKSTENALLLIPHLTYEDQLLWTMRVQRYQFG